MAPIGKTQRYLGHSAIWVTFLDQGISSCAMVSKLRLARAEIPAAVSSTEDHWKNWGFSQRIKNSSRCQRVGCDHVFSQWGYQGNMRCSRSVHFTITDHLWWKIIMKIDWSEIHSHVELRPSRSLHIRQRHWVDERSHTTRNTSKERQEHIQL